MAEKLFKKYYSRVAKEGIIKAILCGLIVGCAMLALAATAFWFFGYREGLWISIALFAVGTGVAAPLFYYRKFKPTTMAIARRVDELGLEERLLTMMELEHDDSFIAMKQREDAMRALSSVNHMLVTIAVSLSLVIGFAAVGVLGLAATTVDVLYYAGAIESGIEIIMPDAFPKTYKITYGVAEDCEGTIMYWAESYDKMTEISEGTEEKLVRTGEGVPTLYAVPANNWAFAGWYDENDELYSNDPYLEIKNVEEDITLFAFFEELDGEDEDEANQNSNGGDGEEGDGEKAPPNPNAPPKPDSGDGGDGDGAGGENRDEKHNQILDGETYYGDGYDNAYQDGMDSMNQDNGISDDMKNWYDDYMGAIEKIGSGDNGD
ncbi:MAG: hypothetical protein IKD43_04845 [Clostridia bacterium]|nr:hypothetical protein [Clostridia bacterium]